MNTASVEYQTSADRRSEFNACDVHLCQHFRNALLVTSTIKYQHYSATCRRPQTLVRHTSASPTTVHRHWSKHGQSTHTHTHTHYFSKNHLIFSHISPGFPRGPLPSRRPTNTQDISSLPFVLHTLTSFSVIVTSADAQKKRLFMHFLQTIVSLSLSLSLSLIQTFYPPLTPHPLFHDKAHHTGEHSKNMSLPIRYICPLQRHSNPMQTAAGVWPLSARNNPTLLGQTVGSCWETTFQSNRF